jgi:hypothetical protein
LKIKIHNPKHPKLDDPPPSGLAGLAWRIKQLPTGDNPYALTLLKPCDESLKALR